MFASIRRYNVDPGSVEEIGRLVQEGFVPIIRQIPGFVAYSIVDGGNGVVASISVYESREAAEQSNQDAADWVGENLASFMPSAPQVTAGEVIVQS
jgi:hypothetical protein